MNGGGRLFRRAGSGRRGFTLAELLVVLSIMGLLAGLLLGVVSAAKRRAATQRIAGDIQAICQALEAYKADFGAYPMIQPPPMSTNFRGAHMLARALIGPGDNDGQAGPGFRVVAGGKVYPPYLNVEQFNVRRDGNEWVLCDSSGTVIRDSLTNQLVRPAIEYYPRRYRVCGDGVTPAPLVGEVNPGKNAYFMFHQNEGVIPAAVLRWALGDMNNDNVIGAGETLVYSGPYIVASPGLDGQFTSGSKSDDVYNFERNP